MSVLEDILGGVRADLAERAAAVPLAEVERLAAAAPPARDPMPDFAAPGISVIAEVKRASPSKGHLAPIGDPAALAGEYAAGGAHAVSVLTERRRFGGSLDDLRAVRAAVSVPVLRKDFVVEPYQLVESRAAGADLVLLIVAALDQETLYLLHQQALELGLTPLIEVHDEVELARAVDLGAALIGINARNLKTLDVDPAAFERLAPHVPEGPVLVAESGIREPEEVAGYAAAGADVVLVGEALVQQDSPRKAVADMIEAGRSQR